MAYTSVRSMSCTRGEREGRGAGRLQCSCNNEVQWRGKSGGERKGGHLSWEGGNEGEGEGEEEAAARQLQ